MSDKPIITATQKKKEIPFTSYQLDIMESMKKMKSCDIIISITRNTTPGSHKINVTHNGSGFIRSLFKK